MRILITGGSGFIGSSLVRLFVKNENYYVLNIDKLTYAGSANNLDDLTMNPHYKLLRGDICDINLLEKAFAEFQPDQVYHLAAESHVDRSIEDPEIFIKTNILGTFHLLNASLKFWKKISLDNQKKFKFLHISFDMCLYLS